MTETTTIAGRAGLASYGGSLARVAELARVAPFAAGLPLRSFLELGAFPGAVPCARLHARQVLWEWGLAALGETSELLVSELVTNAIQISRTATQGTTPPIRLWIVSDKTQAVILVWDAIPLPPVLKDAAEDSETGRGLLLVEALSTQWSWHFPPGPGGKVVWARAVLD